MPELLSSKVVISEEEPIIRGFPSAPSAVYGIVGIAERGPIGTATLLGSYSEYEQNFGGMISGREMALAVRAFYLQGGRQCYVVRTCHYAGGVATAVRASATLSTNAISASAAYVQGSTTGPWVMTAGDTLIGSVDGLADQTATFTATPASVACANAETYDFSAGGDEALTVKIDRDVVQTLTFPNTYFAVPAAATAEEVVIAVNAQIYGAKAKLATGHTKVSIESDRRGTGSYVEITGGSANAILAFSLSEAQGTGNVSNIKAVTISEVETVVEAAWTSGGGVAIVSVSGAVKISTVDTGVASTLQVKSSSTVETVLGLDTALHTGSDSSTQSTLKVWGKSPGVYANSLKAQVTTATSGTASEFNLNVLRGTDVVESFPNVTMDTTLARYVETVVNAEGTGSWYIEADDLSATGTVEQRKPASTSGSTLSAGDDGLASLGDTDYIGDVTLRTGLYALDSADDLTILSVPDSCSATVQKAIVNYCEIVRNKLVFGVLDPQAGLSDAGVRTQQANLGSEGVTENAALYWPRLIIANPSRVIFGSNVQTITVAPSGYIAGIMARDDAAYTEGPFYQPAGTDGGKPYGVVGLENDTVKFDSVRDRIFPLRINPITYLRGYGIFIDGARTLKATGNFPSVGERRGVSYIEAQLYSGLQWVKHRNNTPELRTAVYRDVYALLHGWMRRGAFASRDPATAFFVDVSDALNPPSVVRSGQMVIRVGMATNAPAEFVVIRVVKDTRALEQELFGA
jgi:hypothetical protein